MNVLLKAATIVAPENKQYHLKKRDIHIEDGIIKKIAANIPVPDNARVVTSKNLHVSAGWFDSGVAFGEPGYEERETISNGLNVAGQSGFTDIVLLPNTNPLPDTSSDIVFLKKMAAGSATSLHPLGTLTKNSDGEHLAELFDMHKAGAVGFYDHHKSLENANLLKIALQYVQGFNGIILSFPMDKSVSAQGLVHEGIVSTRLGLKGIAEVAESIQVARDLALLQYTGGKLHFPAISTPNTVEHIRKAREQGLDVSCSVSIHSLYYSQENIEEFDSNFKVLPPLREKAYKKALLKAVLKGDIDMVTSNHIPVDIEEKRVEFEHAAFGSLGLESAFGLLNQLASTEEVVALFTRGRARFGLRDVTIAAGAEARLTVFDPDISYVLKEKDLGSKSKNSMAVGTTLKGKVLGVIANKTVCF